MHLTVFVTGRCNMRCRHCFHWQGVERALPGPTLEELERLATSAARLGPLLWVSLGGGEPFLRDDLPGIAGAFGRSGLRHLAIPTNGLVGEMEARIRGALAAAPETFLSVAISIDGEPAVHDAIRQVPGGHARALEAFRRLRSMADAEPRLGAGLIMTVTRENQDHLAGHIEELVDELRPDNVTLNLARTDAMDTSLLEVDVERYREVVATKERLQRDGRLPYFDFPMARLAAARDRRMYQHVARLSEARSAGRDLGRRHLPCTAGSLSAVIFEDGELRACEVRGDTMGNLAEVDWDLGRLWGSEEARSLRAAIRDERCACTWECAQADNILFQPRAWPGLAADLTAASLRDLGRGLGGGARRPGSSSPA